MIRTTLLAALALLAAPAGAAEDAVEIGRCDGRGTIAVDGLRAGEPLPRAEAQALASRLMTEWRAAHPERRWEAVTVAQRTDQQPGRSQGTTGPSQPSGGSAAATQKGVQAGNTYKNFTERDVRVWEAATRRFVDEGDRIFHDASRLGGTTGISCDMCHPDASNTHPETYPKYQVQLGRVALLRDMVNWCILNPVRGKPLPDDDPRMKAIEAYIMSERRGVAMDHGKH